MYGELWQRVRGHLCAERMERDLREFYADSRWSSFDHILALARNIAAKMRAAGMDEVRLIEFPADGRTTSGAQPSLT